MIPTQRREPLPGMVRWVDTVYDIEAVERALEPRSVADVVHILAAQVHGRFPHQTNRRGGTR